MVQIDYPRKMTTSTFYKTCKSRRTIAVNDSRIEVPVSIDAETCVYELVG
jgi:hypothetical protein